MDTRVSAREHYERGRTLRHAKVYTQALTALREATHDTRYAGQAHTQLALCFRALGRHTDAVAELRHALDSSSLSANEHIHVLYLLGGSLESLGRNAEALEVYGWVRQEDADFLDVQSRIKHLCGIRHGALTRLLQGEDLFQVGRSLLARFVSI